MAKPFFIFKKGYNIKLRLTLILLDVFVNPVNQSLTSQNSISLSPSPPVLDIAIIQCRPKS